MTAWMQHNRVAVHLGIVGLVIIFATSVLLIGYTDTTDVPPEIAVGEPAPQDFVANRTTSEIPDPDKTVVARQAAADAVPEKYDINTTTSQQVLNDINTFYADLAAGATLPVPDPEMTEVPNLIGVPLAEAEAMAEAEGLVTVFGGSVETIDEAQNGFVAQQDPVAGTETEVGTAVTVFVFVLAGTPTSSVPETTTTTVPDDADLPRREVTEQIALLTQRHAVLGQAILTDFVLLHEKDLDRVAEGSTSVFPDMQNTSLEWARDELGAGIREHELNDVKQRFLNPSTRPPMAIAGIPEDDVETTHTAIATLVAQQLQANERVDNAQWEIEKQAARDAVPEQTTQFSFGDPIARQGEILTSVQVAAIVELGLYQPDIILVAPGWALAFFAAISILVFAFLLYRISPSTVQRTRDVILLGIIMSIAAIAARIPGLLTSADNHAIGYVLPAVAIGVMAAILFDQRTALLFVIPMAGFTAIATTDITFTVFAAFATAVPIAFVSSVSSRSQLRLSVVGAAAVVAPAAAGLEFLFRYGSDGSSPWLAGLWAFAGAVIGGFLAQGVVSFLETSFGVTTTMSLLDLLDRNHPALQALEEKAPGTFNHSMLVGSLAGRAARAIGADPLLSQAAAWYHDLGKTGNPQYFVENQLGYNPHDELTPVESAAIIRKHVSDGLDLAKQYRIPDDVADGIRMHHGNSLMRYFYHKALTQDPDVDAESFRHHGVKPRRKEMAIVMISDATEAAARAYAQQEQPTELGLTKLVDDIVTEKLDDGQFDEASLTFGELTTIKSEVVSGLAAYYHARVEYPDFPTSEQLMPAEGS